MRGDSLGEEKRSQDIDSVYTLKLVFLNRTLLWIIHVLIRRNAGVVDEYINLEGLVRIV